jgi:cytochrome oxidase Cu insertion factor (SCO1/SenC/PrrC family)
MNSAPNRFPLTLWLGLALILVILGGTFALSHLQSRKTTPPTAPLPVLGQVADFTLTNQLGRSVTLADLRGKVWVADIIFTRCAGPCPRMTKHMAAVQEALPHSDGTRLVTLTTDPGFDRPDVLQTYAMRFNADAARWWFLTGTKPQIAGLAVDSLKLTALEKPAAERTEADDLFIHSTIFVVVDKQARLRAVFQTEGDWIAWADVQASLLATVHQLEGEP